MNIRRYPSSEYTDGLTSTASITEVLENDWQWSRGGILTTHDASSCLLLAVHDPNVSIGYLGHFPLDFTATPGDKLKRMMQEVKFIADNSELSVWLGGATMLDLQDKDPEILKTYNKMIEKRRSELYIQLGWLSLHEINQDWLRTNENIEHLNFDTGSGSLNYFVGPLKNDET